MEVKCPQSGQKSKKYFGTGALTNDFTHRITQKKPCIIKRSMYYKAVTSLEDVVNIIARVLTIINISIDIKKL